MPDCQRTRIVPSVVMTKTGPDRVFLPQQICDQMLAYASSTPDIEVCGLLGGNANRAFSVYPVKNIARDQSCRFLMDPEEQIDAMRNMRERNEQLWGIYHSHPFSPPVPSDRDRESATYPDVFYFIISLTDKKPVTRCYYFDGMDFLEVSINI